MRAQLAKSSMQKKHINILHAELGHPSKVITHATGRAMGLNLTGRFNHHKDFALEKAKESNICKKSIKSSKIFRQKQFFHISSPMTLTLEGKKHSLLIMEDSTDYA